MQIDEHPYPRKVQTPEEPNKSPANGGLALTDSLIFHQLQLWLTQR